MFNAENNILKAIAVSALLLHPVISQALPIDIPADIAVPAGNVVKAVYRAHGVQTYTCTATDTWSTSSAPTAVLSSSGKRTAIHYVGPYWESAEDGSKIKGTKLAAHASPDTIPWLLLQATVEGTGNTFGNVTYIQRVKTTGGLVPTGTACTQGDRYAAPYTAKYIFYTAE